METDVIVVGAGPVGLALAIELGTRGVRCIVVEARDRGRVVPRAKLANVRTMEHARRWGIADTLRQATPLPPDFSTEVAFVTSVLGLEITRFYNVFFTRSDRDDRFAEPGLQIPQYVLEPVLRDAAEQLPTVRFLDGCRLQALEQNAAEVTATIDHVDGRDPQHMVGSFLVGCDGGGSTVRQQLGIPMLGRRSFARNLGVVFRSPELWRRLRLAPALHYWTVNASTPGFMGPADRHGLWWLQATAIDPSVEIEDLDPVSVVHGALGGEVPIEIVSLDPWTAHALTAPSLGKGRVFLAGDAAHLHSPMGAHGMNQGIGDAVDIGWKLSAVLEGWGGDRLLDSYALERGPTHERMTAEATHNYGLLSNTFVQPGLEGQGHEGDRLRTELAAEINLKKRREFYSLGLVLGLVYEGSPVVVPDGRKSPPPQVDEFVPLARPGGRAPHFWRPDGSSIYDHLGPGFTLLQMTPGVDVEPFERAAEDRRIPLSVVDAHEPEAGSAYGQRLAVVRPDQILVWHGDEVPSDPGVDLDIATGRRKSGSVSSAAAG